jgi:hypothetical protein
MSRSSLTLTGLRSEDIEGTSRMKVTAQIKGLGRQDDALEQLVVRLSLEAGVSSVSWAVHTQVLEEAAPFRSGNRSSRLRSAA